MSRLPCPRSRLPCTRSHLPCPSFYLPEYTSDSDWLHHNNLIYIVILNYILSSEQNRPTQQGGVGQSVRSLKCPGQSIRPESQSVRRESQSVRGESQSIRGRSPPWSMCYKHPRSRPSGTYEPLAVGSIETYIFYFYLTSIHIIYKVAKPNHNVVGPGRID